MRKGYEDINLTLHIRGEGTAKQLEQLTEYSPVYDVVRTLTVKKIEATQRPGAQPPEQHPIM